MATTTEERLDQSRRGIAGLVARARETRAGTTGPVRQPGERALARAWKMIALRGVAGLAFSIVLLAVPHVGLAILVGAVAGLAIWSGFVSFAAAVALFGTARRKRWWLALHAVVEIVGGLALLLWPGLSATALLYVVALWAVVVGLVELVSAFVLPPRGPRTVVAAVGGIALAAFGVGVFLAPAAGAVVLVALLVAFGLVRGTVDVALAVQLRRMAGELDHLKRSWTSAAPVGGA
jgi:uncharacterized membrane protein HdeD (DUF308 family)